MSKDEVVVKFTRDSDGKKLKRARKVTFPAYQPVGRTIAETRARMEAMGMHEKMIQQATKYMKK